MLRRSVDDKEGSPDGSVSRNVSTNLVRPVAMIRRRESQVLRAAVPETAVDEDGEAKLGECEVRPPRQIQPPSPARQPGLSE